MIDIDKQTVKVIASTVFVPSFLLTLYFLYTSVKESDYKWVFAFLVATFLLLHSYGLTMGWF